MLFIETLQRFKIQIKSSDVNRLFCPLQIANWKEFPRCLARNVILYFVECARTLLIATLYHSWRQTEKVWISKSHKWRCRNNKNKKRNKEGLSARAFADNYKRYIVSRAVFASRSNYLQYRNYVTIILFVNYCTYSISLLAMCVCVRKKAFLSLVVNSWR